MWPKQQEHNTKCNNYNEKEKIKKEPIQGIHIKNYGTKLTEWKNRLKEQNFESTKLESESQVRGDRKKVPYFKKN